MKFLITSDIHLNDAPKSSYRFGLFPWLAKQQEIHRPDALIIAGDLTDEKDYHSSSLVNQTVDGFRKLKPPVYTVRGNHDGIDPNNPFFKFLNEIPGIIFCINTTIIEKYKLALIPHQPNQAALDKAFKQVPDGFLAITHVMFTGAISETSSHLTGLAVPPSKARKVLSGDIHRPQTIHTPNGDVTYIGSPYAVRHGDHFEPRVLLLDDWNEINLSFPAPKKLSLTIRDVSEIPSLKKGDQVKLTLELDRSEVVEWLNHKKNILEYLKERNVEVYGIKLKVAQKRKRPTIDNSQTGKSNLDYFKSFCLAEQVPANIKQAGLDLIEGK